MATGVVSHDVEASRLDDAALLDRIAADDAEIARLQARQHADLAEFARRPTRINLAGEDPVAIEATWPPVGVYARDTADHEVAMRLRIGRRSAENRLRLACALQRLPLTNAAFADGRIDLTRARVIADEVMDLDPTTAREVEARVIEPAERLTAARLRVRVKKAVEDADPVASDVRNEREKQERRVTIEPAENGMAWLHAYLTAPEARVVHTALTAAARGRKATRKDQRREDESETMDGLRADALVAMCAHALKTGELPDFGPLAKHLGEVATIHVTVAANTLLGFDDAPAVLAGYGPVTANVARELSLDARWRRILTDPRSGAVLDVGTTVYRPPPAIARHVEARDQTCIAPGCGMPAARCELDHIVPFPNGPTSADNLHAECKAHHLLKHSGFVNVENLPDNGTRWTMPTGHTYDTRPPPVGQVWATAADDEYVPVAPWWVDAFDDF